MYSNRKGEDFLDTSEDCVQGAVLVVLLYSFGSLDLTCL